MDINCPSIKKYVHPAIRVFIKLIIKFFGWLILPVLLAGCVQAYCSAPKPAAAGDLKNSFVLVGVGDIVHPLNFGDAMEFKALGKKMYEPGRALILSGDISFANLEGAFSRRKPTANRPIMFTADPGDLDNILWSGFNLFSLANNHATDAGPEGAGLSPEQARRPAVFTVPGKNITAVFFAYGNLYESAVNSFHPENIRSDLLAVKADIRIVSLHWGIEYDHVPGRELVESYRKIIDAGADIILGHHPHVAQGVEMYRGKPIFYSLGNYAMGTRTNRHLPKKASMFSMAVRLTFVKSPRGMTVQKAEIFPLLTDNMADLRLGEKIMPLERFVTRPAKADFAGHILGKFREWSAAIPDNKTVFRISGDTMQIFEKESGKENANE